MMDPIHWEEEFSNAHIETGCGGAAQDHSKAPFHFYRVQENSIVHCPQKITVLIHQVYYLCIGVSAINGICFKFERMHLYKKITTSGFI